MTEFYWIGYDGSEYSKNSAKVTLKIINTPPTVNDFQVTGNEDETVWFRKYDFIGNFNDVNNDKLTKIKITKVPMHGVLKVSGSLVTTGQQIALSSLNNLAFLPDEDWYGETNLSWQAHDGFNYSSNEA